MKKRILSFLMALALVLSVLPASLITVQEASAESILASSPSAHTHDDTWKPYSGTGQIKGGGKYYLTDDSAIYWGESNQTFTLCLNGHSLTGQSSGSRLAEIHGGSHFTICDCQAEFDSAGNLVSENKIVPCADSSYSGLFTMRNTNGARSLTLENVVIDGTGVTPTSTCGGAVLTVWNSAGATINMENCVVKNCAAKDYGVFNFDYAGTLKTNNVVFTGNTAAKGCIVNMGGNADGTVIDLSNSKFQSNAATTTDKKGLGGIINVASGAADVEIDLTNCEFKSNSADDAGGVIYSNGNMAFTATDCHFEDNQVGSGKTAGSGGGVIRNDGTGTIDFDSCTFKKNKNLNTGGYGGAAILISGGGAKLTVTDCDFIENASSYQGGAVAISYGNNENTFTGCTFKDNTATSVGGALLLWSAAKTVTFNDCTFEGNRGSNGSVIYSNQNVVMNDCTVANNKGTGSTGAAIYMEETTVSSAPVDITFTASGNTQVYGNTAAVSGKANVYLAGTNKMALGTMGQQANIQVATAGAAADPSTFLSWTSNATKTAATGVTYTSSAPAKTVVFDTAGNTFAFQTRALQVPEGSVSYHTHDETWTAWDGKTTMESGKKYYLTKDVTYGKTYVDANITLCLNGFNAISNSRFFEMKGASTLTICDCQAQLDAEGNLISSNKMVPANSQGSIVNMRDQSSTKNGKLKMEYVVCDGAGITNTTAGGVAIVTWNPHNLLEINNCVFKNMTASGNPGNGAAIYLESGGTLRATDVVFKDNTSAGFGAAIAGKTANNYITLTGCAFENNTSKVEGAAINMPGGELTMTDCSFDENEGIVGAVSFQGKLKADNCSFTNNLGLGSGGAVRGHTSVTSAVMNNCDFTGNTAHGYGGAISIEAGTIVLNGCDFTKNLSRNTSSEGGGAIYGSRSITAINCTFTENRANYNGGAILTTSNCTGQFTDCTFTNNTAGNLGGGIYNNGWTRLIGGNVITDNTAAGAPNNLYHTGANANYYIRIQKLNENTKIGISTALADGGHLMTSEDNSSTYKAGMVFSDDAARGIVGDTDGSKSLSIGAAIAKVGTSGYANAASAVAAAGNDKVMQLLAAVEGVPAAEGLKLDLNGKNVGALTGTGAVTLMDTATDDYDVADGVYGKIAEVDEGVTLNSYTRVNGKRYIVLTDDNGTHAHRIYAAVTAKALRAKNEGIGYTAKFGADQVLQNAMTGYGMELAAGQNAAQAIDVKVKAPNRVFENGKDLVFVVTDFFAQGDVNTNAKLNISGTPFVKVGETVYTAEADTKTVTFQEMFNYANDNFNAESVKDAARAAVSALYTKYATDMTAANGWKFDNVAQYAAQ